MPVRANPALPALFVVLWSTGFISAKYGLPYAPPLKFLLLRFTFVAILMTIVSIATRATWTRCPISSSSPRRTATWA